jgi:hypothetical protein
MQAKPQTNSGFLTTDRADGHGWNSQLEPRRPRRGLEKTRASRINFRSPIRFQPPKSGRVSASITAIPFNR